MYVCIRSRLIKRPITIVSRNMLSLAAQWWTAIVVASCLIVFALSYYFSVSTFDKWRKLGVPYVPPVPLFGNILTVVTGIDHPVHLYNKLYYALAGHKYGGFFQMRTPYLMVRDPAMINQMLIKDFSYFSDRGVYSDFSTNPLASGLFFMDNPKWRIMRNKLTPAFSSGKFKSAYGQMDGCVKELTRRLRVNVTGRDGAVEVRDLMANYSIDVIGVYGFGLEMKSVPYEQSAFHTYVKRVFKPSLSAVVKETCLMITPALLKVVKLKDFPADATDYFRSAFDEMIAYRANNNVARNDLVQQLMQARNDLVLNTNLPPAERFTESNIAANAFLIYSAGVEALSTALTMCLYELALKKHVQDRVREEIKSKITKRDGVISMELLNDLRYVEMVIAETLRKYPSTFGIFRKATKTYHAPDDSLVVEKDEKIMIPIYSLHHDPKYFKDPEVFDPERFSPEENAKRPKGTYLPFGDGPRICIGKRFVELQMKMALAEILTKFEVEPCEKTVVPLSLTKMVIFLTPDHDIWLKFVNIN